ncbi:MAG: hypothetical protein ACK4GT_18995, partial [Pararhodobacter sp.]
KLSAEDAVAHFDWLTAAEPHEADRVRCRSFIARMSARPEGISLRQVRQLADAVAAPAPHMIH